MQRQLLVRRLYSWRVEGANTSTTGRSRISFTLTQVSMSSFLRRTTDIIRPTICCECTPSHWLTAGIHTYIHTYIYKEYLCYRFGNRVGCLLECRVCRIRVIFGRSLYCTVPDNSRQFQLSQHVFFNSHSGRSPRTKIRLWMSSRPLASSVAIQSARRESPQWGRSLCHHSECVLLQWGRFGRVMDERRY